MTSSLIMSLFSFRPTLENTFLLVLPSPARLVWVTPMMSLIRRLHSTSWAALTADYFVPDFTSGYAFRIISSAESFIIMWRRTFPILNSSTSEDIGSFRFPELVYKRTFEKQGGTPRHLRKYLLLYCWIRSMRDMAISYICKGHKRRGSRLCWLHQVFIFPGRLVLSIDFINRFKPLLSEPLYPYDDQSLGLNKDVRDSLPASPWLMGSYHSQFWNGSSRQILQLTIGFDFFWLSLHSCPREKVIVPL